MKFLNNKKPKKGWRFRLYKINVAVSQYLSGKISKRHNEELWTYISKNPEMFEELVIREKMDKALKSGEVDEVMDYWDKFAEIMNMDTDQLKTDEKIDETLLGTAKIFKDISRKLQEYKDKTGNNTFPWKGYVDQQGEKKTEEFDDQEIQTSTQPSKTKRLWSFYKQYAAAAIILFIVGMGISTLMFMPGQTNESIYQKYYSPYNFYQKVNSGSFAEFEQFYKNGNYTKAKLVLQTKDFDHPYSKEIKNFYLGLAHMGEANYRQAIGYFHQVLESPFNTYLKDESRWYQGLAYLKCGHKQEALQCFRTLKQKDIPNQDKARKVIRRIR